MSRLIVLSNRVAKPTATSSQLSGGLAVALEQALQDQSGIWIGWNGQTADLAQLGIDDESRFEQQQIGTVDYLTTSYSQSEYQHFYGGFSNNVLWPALHGRLDLVQTQQEDFTVYEQVNALYAQQLNHICQPNDVIWVHDYHFLSVAYHCRRLGMVNRIGFFLHIPFVDSTIWRCIPHADQLTQHLLKYDLVGLQTAQDVTNCLNVLKPYQLSKDHHCQIGHYPIGIAVDYIHTLALTHQPSLELLQLLSQKKPHDKYMIAVERIDYTKGLLARLSCFSDFLTAHPYWRTHAKLLQVACPCRTEIENFADFEQQFRRAVTQFSAQWNTGVSQPLQCYYHNMPYGQLMALFRHMDVGWVNSLADGMNLVAKEYIAAQDADHPGCLILSKYAGAAQQMDAALIIDPLDSTAVSQALERALTMSLAERQERHLDLVQGLKRDDITLWRERFLADLRDDCYDVKQRSVITLS